MKKILEKGGVCLFSQVHLDAKKVYSTISDESNLHQGPILITEVDEHGMDVSSTTPNTSGCVSDADTSLDVVNISSEQHQNPQNTQQQKTTQPQQTQNTLVSI